MAFNESGRKFFGTSDLVVAEAAEDGLAIMQVHGVRRNLSSTLSGVV